MRITDHPILPALVQQEVEFDYAGKSYKGLEGDSIAAALLAQGVRMLRRSEKNGQPRGLYCGIGHCYECRIHLEGTGQVRACVTAVANGMRLYPEAGGGESHEG